MKTRALTTVTVFPLAEDGSVRVRVLSIGDVDITVTIPEEVLWFLAVEEVMSRRVHALREACPSLTNGFAFRVVRALEPA